MNGKGWTPHGRGWTPHPISSSLREAAFAEPWLQSSAPGGCVSRSESSICSAEQAQPSGKKGQLLPPPAPLQVGSRESSPQHRGCSLGSSPPDYYPTRPCESSKAPLGPARRRGSKAEEKPRARGLPGSRRGRNKTSQSLPHDLSSPLGPGNLMGCDTGAGLQEGIVASRDAER